MIFKLAASKAAADCLKTVKLKRKKNLKQATDLWPQAICREDCKLWDPASQYLYVSGKCLITG